MEIFSRLSQSQRPGGLGAGLTLVCTSPVGAAHACGLGRWGPNPAGILAVSTTGQRSCPEDVGKSPHSGKAACTPHGSSLTPAYSPQPISQTRNRRSREGTQPAYPRSPCQRQTTDVPSANSGALFLGGTHTITPALRVMGWVLSTAPCFSFQSPLEFPEDRLHNENKVSKPLT